LPADFLFEAGVHVEPAVTVRSEFGSRDVFDVPHEEAFPKPMGTPLDPW